MRSMNPRLSTFLILCLLLTSTVWGRTEGYCARETAELLLARHQIAITSEDRRRDIFTNPEVPFSDFVTLMSEKGLEIDLFFLTESPSPQLVARLQSVGRHCSAVLRVPLSPNVNRRGHLMSIEKVTKNKMLLLDAGSGDMLEIDWRALGAKSTETLVAFVTDSSVDSLGGHTDSIAMTGFFVFCLGSLMLLLWIVWERRFRISVACIFSIAIVSGCEKRVQLTKLRFDPAVLDLGVLKQHEEIEFIAALRNEGPNSVDLTKLETTCGCFAVSFERMTLSPRSVVDVKAKLRATAPGPWEQLVTAHGVAQGAPIRCLLPVKYHVEPSVTLSPLAFALGAIGPGDPVRDVLALRVVDPAGEFSGRTLAELESIGKWTLAYQLVETGIKLEDGDVVEMQYEVPPEAGGYFVDKVNIISGVGVNRMVFTVVVTGRVLRDP